MSGRWVKPEVREAVVELVDYGITRVGMPLKRLLRWLGLAPGKYYDWKRRQGQPNRHNGQIPSRHWLQPWEREAIVAYTGEHPLDGYRRLCYRMIDEHSVACAPSTVYRVLKSAGLLQAWEVKASSKGQGFEQPTAPLSTGTSISPISTSLVRSIICAACWMATAALLCIGLWRRP